MSHAPVSAVIITFNEERNIGRCLDSLKGVADEILVVDSFSVDRTEEICRSRGVAFHSKEWLGYSEQKNYANQLASNNWILSLDADEELSEELKNAILALKKKGEPRVARFARLTNYCGHWVRHGGWYPDYKVRMFDRRKVKWQGIIHEELKGFSEEEVLLLKGDCLHYSYYTIGDHYRQTEKFTTLSAREMFAKGKKPGFLKLYISPIAKFINDYFFRLGFLDGKTGFVIAKISAGATRMKYKKLKELYRNK